MNEPKVRRIGVLTSGGDAPGMNTAVCAVFRTARSLGIECVGVMRGYNGLISGDMHVLTVKELSGMMGRGGTVLYTARSEEFRTAEGRQRAYDNCRFAGLDGLITIGGDGTFRGALELHKLGMPVIGIPATIDNDIASTSYTIGYDTSCNTIIECIDRLSDTMQSHERCSVVEVMGRRAGYLAIYAGVSAGAAAILIPEREIDFEHDVVERIRASKLNGRTHFTVIVAEGAPISTDEVAKRIHDETGIGTRITILGHLQRGGAPLARDRVTAVRMGYRAVNLLAEGRHGLVLGMYGQELRNIDIEEALSMSKTIDSEMFGVADDVAGVL